MAFDRIDVRLVNEIKSGLDVREDVEQAIAREQDRFRQAAGELQQGGGQSLGSIGLDHVEHGLGLRQVEPARQKRAKGELARLGQTSAAR